MKKDNGTAKHTVQQLETERLLLRGLLPEDAADLYEYASVPAVSKYVPWEAHRSVEDASAYINTVIASAIERRKTWAIELKKEHKMIGTINLFHWNPVHARAELAYILSSAYWGEGLTHEAASEVAKHGFTEMSLNRIEAKILLENMQSRRVAEKLGMQLEGIARQHMSMKGRYVDLALYGILRDEFFDPSP